MNCLEVSAISHVWFAIRTDEKLFEIPRNVIPLYWRPSNKLGVVHQWDWIITGGRKAFLQKIKHRMGFFTVHRNFLHYWKVGSEAVPWTDMTERLDDFCSIGIFLMSKLITREAQDDELICELGDQLIHLGEVPCSCSSQRSYILHKDHLTPISTEVDIFTSQSFGWKFEKTFYSCWTTRHFGSKTELQLSAPVLSYDHFTSNAKLNNTVASRFFFPTKKIDDKRSD